MEENSKQRILLSVIGVAILVVAVIGVSFAFFTYSRTGESNNVITTGNLVFHFDDGQTITLNNHFPIDGMNTAGAGIAYTGSTEVCTFTVVGNTTPGATINFQVYAVPGDSEDGKTRFADSEVFLNIKRTDTSANGTFTGNASYYNTAAAGIVMTDEQLQLGTGTITGAAATTTMSFEVRMWVDSSKVAVSDTAGTIAGKTVYTTSAYALKYYSIKIKVEGQA